MCIKLKNDSDKNIYFRGENQEFSHRIPGIFRSQKNDNTTEFIYRDLIKYGTKSYYLDLFEKLGWEYDKYFLKLTDLQHYGAVTNILDITLTPLVSLFFACLGGEGHDGKVYVYEPNNEFCEKRYSGHTVSLITALNFMDREKIERFLYIFDYLKKIIPENSSQALCLSRTNTSEVITSLLKKNFKQTITQANIEEYGEEKFTEAFKKLDIKNMQEQVAIVKTEKEAKEEIVEFMEQCFKKDYYINYLKTKYDDAEFRINIYQDYMLEKLREELESFLIALNDALVKSEVFKYPYAIYEDIKKSYIVKTIKINERIKNQQGAFIIPGYISTKGKRTEQIQYDINNSINDSIKTISIITIPSDKKIDILKELRYLGFDEGFIYPDIKHIAKSVLEKYKD